MTEIRVPVTAPGANQAANELRGVASAAQGVGQAEEQAAKGADRLAKAHAAAAKGAKSASQAFLEQSRALAAAARAEEAAARARGRNENGLSAVGHGIGGEGGRLARHIGGGASEGGLGLLAAGAGVAAFGLMKLAEISAHAVDRATALAKAFVDMAQIVRNGQKQRGANALSAFGENEQVLRQLIAAGVPLSRATALGRQGFKDAPEALVALQGYSDPGKAFGRSETALQVAKTLKLLGVTSSLVEGLNKLPEDRVANAINGGGGQMQLLREIIGEARGGQPVSVRTVTDMIQRSRYSSDAHQLDQTAGAEGGFRGVRLNAAADPEAQAAVMAERAAWVDPITAAISESNKAFQDQLQVMEAAADAQGIVAKILANVTSPNGSLRVQVDRAKEDNAAVVLGSSF